ncbi:MAG: SLC13 family permease [Oscillospiraceae bacterium]
MKKSSRKGGSLLLGPICFLLCTFLLPSSVFSYEARAAIGTLAWMGVWWVALPVHTGVTGFIPLVVNALFCLAPMETLLVKYANDTIFLLIGADLISISWTVTGLDKRIALKCLYLIGPSLTQQIVVWFLVSTVLSMFLPNMVVCAMLAPIALSMLCYVGEGDLRSGKIAPIILVSIAWGAGIGGMGTPLGGAMNLVAIDYLEELIGQEFMYTAWFIRLMPLMLAVILADLVCLMLLKPKKINLQGSREYFRTMYQELPSISRDEKVSLALFAVVMFLCFARSLYAGYLPELKPAYVFLVFGILTFVIPKESGGYLNTWEHASRELGWGLIFMCGGGMAIGALLSSTGAIDGFAGITQRMNLTGGFGTVLVFSVFTVLLSELSNNTSAAAISIPIVISICEGVGRNPLPYVYTVIAAFNCAYMLPTTIRAIPVGMGLQPKYLLSKGALLTVSSAVVVAAVGYLLMMVWPGFSTY